MMSDMASSATECFRCRAPGPIPRRKRSGAAAPAAVHRKAARCAQRVGVTVLSMFITRFIPLAGWGEALSPGAHAERPSAAAAAAAPPAAALESCALTSFSGQSTVCSPTVWNFPTTGSRWSFRSTDSARVDTDLYGRFAEAMASANIYYSV